MKHEALTRQIIGAFYTVYNALGYGFLENVYENALAIELRQRGVAVQQQARIDVYYAGQSVGTYFANLLVANTVIVELKAARAIEPQHEAQLLNYLNATKHEVGLLLNFGPEPKVKRKVFDNRLKRYESAIYTIKGPNKSVQSVSIREPFVFPIAGYRGWRAGWRRRTPAD